MQGNMAQACQRSCRQGEELRVMLLGDGAVGKTSMIISYIFNGYKSEYRPTALDVYTGLVHVDEVPTGITLIDPAGQEEFGRLRSLCYAHVDVFILCFSLVNPVSFDNITSRWLPQIRAGNPTSPIVLAGTQWDVLVGLDRCGSRAGRLKHRIGAQDYVECSALTQHNLKHVFDCAIAAALRHRHTGTKAKKLSLMKRIKSFYPAVKLLSVRKWREKTKCI